MNRRAAASCLLSVILLWAIVAGIALWLAVLAVFWNRVLAW